MKIYNSLAITRIICGAVVFLFGLLGLGLFGFEPPLADQGGRQFQTAMHEAGYFLPIITAVFLVSGATLMIDRFGALGTILLTPISVNIVLFHTLLNGGSAPLAYLLFVLNVYCLWYYRKAYAPLLRARVNSRNG